MKKTSKKKRDSQIEKNAGAKKPLEHVPGNTLIGELQRRVQEKQIDPNTISVLIARFSVLFQLPKPLAEHVVKSSDKEQRHRHKQEDAKTNASIEAERRGQRFALTIVLAFLVSAIACFASTVVLFMGGKIWAGSALFGGSALFSRSLFQLAHLFITGRKKDD